MNKHTGFWPIFAGFFISACINQTAAQVPGFTYQGLLSSGTNRADGTYDFRVSIFATASGGVMLTSPITNSAVPVSGGLFSVTLNFSNSLFVGADRWLDLAVRKTGETNFTGLAPRQLVAATPYALYAPNAGAAAIAASVALNAVGPSSLQNGAVDSSKIADGSIAPNDLNSALLNNTFWRTIGNSGTSVGTNFIGTTDNQPLEVRVNGLRVLRIEQPLSGGSPTDAPNLIGGSSQNRVGTNVMGATIAGGAVNSVYSECATIGGGYGGLIGERSAKSTIGGGFGNGIGPNTTVATISGGCWNSIQTNASGATIGGGGDHLIGTNASRATIGGGNGNSILSYSGSSTIAGGSGNIIEVFSPASVIGGGAGNGIRNEVDHGTISGGQANSIGNEASGATIAGGSAHIIRDGAQGSAIGGGYHNIVETNAAWAAIAGGSENLVALNSFYATVGGGLANSISPLSEGSTIGGGLYNSTAPGADFATIPGGFYNVVAAYGFAAGVGAKATNRGAFVWNDSNASPTSSTNDNSVTFRASGGFRLFSDGTDVGVYLAPGSGAWASLSDRNAKENVKPVNPKEVLAKVCGLQVAKWNYKSQNCSIQHIGPMAQDFSAAFEVGEDDRHISTVDESGVALAAIQALHEIVNTQNLEMKEKDARIQALERRLDDIERSLPK